MTSPNDNPRLPLTSGSASIVKYTEMRAPNPMTSTNLPMTSIPRTDRLKSQQSLSVNEYELRRMPVKQRRVVKKTLMANVGYRLAKRKKLHIQR
jgi:hypothetical protein